MSKVYFKVVREPTNPDLVNFKKLLENMQVPFISKLGYNRLGTSPLGARVDPTVCPEIYFELSDCSFESLIKTKETISDSISETGTLDKEKNTFDLIIYRTSEEDTNGDGGSFEYGIFLKEMYPTRFGEVDLFTGYAVVKFNCTYVQSEEMSDWIKSTVGL